MDLNKYYDFFKTLNIVDKQSVYNAFQLFGFESLQGTNIYDEEILKKANEILRLFITSQYTKDLFWSNARNSLNDTLEYIVGILISSSKCGSTYQEIVKTFLDLFLEVGVGLLKCKLASRLTRVLLILNNIFMADHTTEVKERAYACFALVLELILLEKGTVDKPALIIKILKSILEYSLDNDISLHIFKITALYLRGVQVDLFEEIDNIKNFIQFHCVPNVKLDASQDILVDLLKCISTLLTTEKYSAFSTHLCSHLVKKLNIFAYLMDIISPSAELCHIVSFVVITYCDILKLPIKHINITKDFGRICNFWRGTDFDLTFVVLYIQCLYSKVTIKDSYQVTLIGDVITHNPEPGLVLLKCICLVSAVISLELPRKTRFNATVFDLMEKNGHQLDEVITYDAKQLAWILNDPAAAQSLKKNVLHLWLRNYKGDVLIKTLRRTNCGDLLIDCLNIADIRKRTASLMREINDPLVRSNLCDRIPRGMYDYDLLTAMLNAKAAVPDSAKVAIIYVKNMHLLAIHLMRSQTNQECCISLLEYLFESLLQYRMNRDIFEHFTNETFVRALLETAAADAKSDTAECCLKICLTMYHTQPSHAIESQRPLPVPFESIFLPQASPGVIKMALKLLLKLLYNKALLPCALTISTANVTSIFHRLLALPMTVDSYLHMRALRKIVEKFEHVAREPYFDLYIVYWCKDLVRNPTRKPILKNFVPLLKEWYSKTLTMKNVPLTPSVKDVLLSFKSCFQEYHCVNLVFIDTDSLFNVEHNLY